MVVRYDPFQYKASDSAEYDNYGYKPLNDLDDHISKLETAFKVLNGCKDNLWLVDLKDSNGKEQGGDPGAKIEDINTDKNEKKKIEDLNLSVIENSAFKEGSLSLSTYSSDMKQLESVVRESDRNESDSSIKHDKNDSLELDSYKNEEPNIDDIKNSNVSISNTENSSIKRKLINDQALHHSSSDDYDAHFDQIPCGIGMDGISNDLTKKLKIEIGDSSSSPFNKNIFSDEQADNTLISNKSDTNKEAAVYEDNTKSSKSKTSKSLRRKIKGFNRKSSSSNEYNNSTDTSETAGNLGNTGNVIEDLSSFVKNLPSSTQLNDQYKKVDSFKWETLNTEQQKAVLKEALDNKEKGDIHEKTESNKSKSCLNAEENKDENSNSNCASSNTRESGVFSSCLDNKKTEISGNKKEFNDTDKKKSGVIYSKKSNDEASTGSMLCLKDNLCSYKETSDSCSCDRKQSNSGTKACSATGLDDTAYFNKESFIENNNSKPFNNEAKTGPLTYSNNAVLSQKEITKSFINDAKKSINKMNQTSGCSPEDTVSLSGFTSNKSDNLKKPNDKVNQSSSSSREDTVSLFGSTLNKNNRSKTSLSESEFNYKINSLDRVNSSQIDHNLDSINKEAIDAELIHKNDELKKLFDDIYKILNKGDRDCDIRLDKQITATIKKLELSNDPFTCKVAIQLSICCKYIKDFIELRDLVNKRQ